MANFFSFGSWSQRRATLRQAGTATGTAVQDPARVGDIHGAFGTVRAADLDHSPSWPRRLRYLLAIMGPGLIVMVGDNDAGGVATYAQAGQDYGTRLLWVLALLIPVLIVNQEMVVRLGAVTGVGHARLIHERFGRFWAAFSIGDLVLVNGLTIVTEFIGVALAGSYFGIPRWLSVAGAAALLVAFTVSGSFRSWERWMYVLIAVNVVMLPLIFLTHPRPAQMVHNFVVPGFPGGLNSGVLLLVIAIIGTTVAPWQLFFQQSNVVDKRITPRWISYERADTVIGSFVVVTGAALLIGIAAFGLGGTVRHGQFTDAGGVAAGLGHAVGHCAGALFALLLLDASLIGAAAVTLATSYALGDMPAPGTRCTGTSRRPGLLWLLRVLPRRRGHSCADSRRPARAHHRGGAGAGRRTAPVGGGVPGPALQRQGHTRAVGEPSMAECRGRGDHRRTGAAVAGADRRDAVPVADRRAAHRAHGRRGGCGTGQHSGLGRPALACPPGRPARRP